MGNFKGWETRRRNQKQEEVRLRDEGAARERARIRQLALDEAEKAVSLTADGPRAGGFRADALRDFAALLEDR